MQAEQAAEIGRLKRLLAQREEEVAILKNHRVLCQGIAVRYAWMKSQEGVFSVQVMCRALKVQRSGYHAWRRPRKGKRAERIQRLDEAIRRQFEAHKGRYGSPRLTKELHKPKVGAWDALV